MNEIDKLKIEHARYKKALVVIEIDMNNRTAARIACEALNPPPPPPVTLHDITSALAKWKAKTDDYIAILLNPDESGILLAGSREEEIFQFNSLRQALDYLNDRESW